MDENNITKQSCDHDNGKAGVCERLLDAAEKLFLQKGFNQTSVRDITQAADCKFAAVNYHFGSKEKLYTEMFRRQMAKMINEHIERVDVLMSQPETTLGDLIRTIAEPCLRSVEHNEPRGAMMRLMIREVLNQTINPADFVADMKIKFIGKIKEALMKLEPGLDERSATLAVFSLDALAMHPFLFMPFYTGWIPGMDVNQILDHIESFATAAIKNYKK